MRYSASKKLEIIRQVEQSHLPATRTLDIPRTTSRGQVAFLGELCVKGRAWGVP